jgi:hypothetical protein
VFPSLPHGKDRSAAGVPRAEEGVVTIVDEEHAHSIRGDGEAGRDGEPPARRRELSPGCKGDDGDRAVDGPIGSSSWRIGGVSPTVRATAGSARCSEKSSETRSSSAAVTPRVRMATLSERFRLAIDDETGTTAVYGSSSTAMSTAARRVIGPVVRERKASSAGWVTARKVLSSRPCSAGHARRLIASICSAVVVFHDLDSKVSTRLTKPAGAAQLAMSAAPIGFRRHVGWRRAARSNIASRIGSIGSSPRIRFVGQTR